MSLLHFWNRNKLERDGDEDDSAASNPAGIQEQPVASGGHGAAPEPPHSAGHTPTATGSTNGKKLNLEEIRAALDKIAEIIHDDEERERNAETRAGNFTPVEFTVGDVANLVPHLFRDRDKAVFCGDKVTVQVENLYEQLKSGKVTTTVRRVVAEMDEELLVPEYVECQKDTISIPLHLAVTAVRPDELKKRTSSTERDDGLDSMPNLFSPPTGAAPVKPPMIETDDLLKPAAAIRPPAKPAQPKPPEPKPAQSVPVEPAAAADDDEIFRRPSLGEKPTGLPADRNLDLGLGAGSRFGSVPKESKESKESKGSKGLDRDGMQFEIGEQTDMFKRAPRGPTQDDAAGRAAPAEAAPPERKESPKADGPTPEKPVPVESGRPPAMAEQEAHALDDDEAVADDAAVPVPSQTQGKVTLRGVDLNTASKREMTDRLDGVGVKLAERIERHRRLHGPFNSLSDLTRVSGVGPSTFERMTGQSWSEARDDTRRTLDYLLGPDDDPMPDLRAAAKRFCSLPSCEGCIFTHEDGHVLASEWDHPSQQVLGAVIPQIFKKTEPYMDQLEIGEVNPVTLFFGDTGITMVRCGDTYLALVHRIGRLSKRQIQLVQLAGAELEARLDRIKGRK